MPQQDHGPTIKDDKLYDELRKKGDSKEKAARIANARANPDMHPSKEGGKALPYEEWTLDDLYERAQEIDVEGRSDMSKEELIEALRSR